MLEWVATKSAAGEPASFGMLGVNPGTSKPLSYGTEVVVVDKQLQDDGSTMIEIVGDRCFEVLPNPTGVMQVGS